MPIEIERKFEIRDDSWRQQAGAGQAMRQGYICNDCQGSVRIRISDNGAWLNIKSATLGISRREYEYPIPLAEAEEMLSELCAGTTIDKTRYKVSVGGRIWEVDVFFGENAGLVLAEVELEAEDQELEYPPWVGKEVSGDSRYYNVNLVSHPFKSWGS